MTDAQNSEKATPAEVREWAKANGYAVADKGRIPKHVRQEYTAATGRAA